MVTQNTIILFRIIALKLNKYLETTPLLTCMATCKGVYPEELATLTLAPCSIRRAKSSMSLKLKYIY